MGKDFKMGSCGSCGGEKYNCYQHRTTGSCPYWYKIESAPVTSTATRNSPSRSPSKNSNRGNNSSKESSLGAIAQLSVLGVIGLTVTNNWEIIKATLIRGAEYGISGIIVLSAFAGIYDASKTTLDNKEHNHTELKSFGIASTVTSAIAGSIYYLNGEAPRYISEWEKIKETILRTSEIGISSAAILATALTSFAISRFSFNRTNFRNETSKLSALSISTAITSAVIGSIYYTHGEFPRYWTTPNGSLSQTSEKTSSPKVNQSTKTPVKENIAEEEKTPTHPIKLPFELNKVGKKYPTQDDKKNLSLYYFYDLLETTNLLDTSGKKTTISITKGSCVSILKGTEVKSSGNEGIFVWIKTDEFISGYVYDAKLIQITDNMVLNDCLAKTSQEETPAPQQQPRPTNAAAIAADPTIKPAYKDLPEGKKEFLRTHFRVDASVLNVRSAPNASSAVKAKLGQNSCITVEFEEKAHNGFIHMMAQSANAQKIDGYVATKYLTAIATLPEDCIAALK